MTAEKVLNELVSRGWFQKGDDGWHRVVAAPVTVRGIDRFVHLVTALGAHSASLKGIPALVEVQTDPGVDDLMFRVRKEKVIEK